MKTKKQLAAEVEETLAEFVCMRISMIAIHEETGDCAVSYDGINWESTARCLAEELAKERDETY